MPLISGPPIDEPAAGKTAPSLDSDGQSLSVGQSIREASGVNSQPAVGALQAANQPNAVRSAEPPSDTKPASPLDNIKPGTPGVIAAGAPLSGAGAVGTSENKKPLGLGSLFGKEEEKPLAREALSLTNIKPLGAEAGKQFGAFVVGFVIASLLVTGAAYFLKSQHQATLAQKEQEYENEIQGTLKSKRFIAQKELVSNTGQQVTALKKAIAEKIKLSQFLTKITSAAYKQAQWTSFRLAEEKIVISGTVANFTELAKTIAAFKNLTELSNVALTSATLDPEAQKVKFTLEANLSKEAPSAQEKTPAAESAATESVSASTSVPSELTTGNAF